MAISRKEFEEESFLIYKGIVSDVWEFLKKDKDSAYTSKEISESLKVSQASINGALKKLKTLGMVEIKKPYYIAKSESKGSSKRKKEVTETETEDTELENQ